MFKKSCPLFIVYSLYNNGQAILNIQYALPSVVPQIIDGRDGQEEHDEHPAVVDDHMLYTFLTLIVSGGGGHIWPCLAQVSEQCLCSDQYYEAKIVINIIDLFLF